MTTLFVPMSDPFHLPEGTHIATCWPSVCVVLNKEVRLIVFVLQPSMGQLHNVSEPGNAQVHTTDVWRSVNGPLLLHNVRWLLGGRTAIG